ncbi:uncharacterized protein F4807DRAFT_455177 [Annulohypoxylon truncatum]|uniref:uncharacterized protein n=1 Tax=Annulohypoxylon truncatum TaxID=327061 RepID=UPI002008A799|nr:uncharacterized protein F4807DRAFT_455177 [Annulohypoxylon truncatum]KAI1214727.1 hypothetical protein F4807DRAFT_455177 [Annulohypoxylon truncatum]
MASPDQSTPPTSIASYEEPPPTIQFTNIEALCQAIEEVSGDFLVVQNVSPTDFEEINRQEPRRFRLRRYHADKEILIITIPNDLHEALHIGIYRRYDYQLGPGGIESWRSIGSTTLRPRGHPGGDGGEGDSCGGPKPARNHKGAWPTLVIEAGDSESLGALRDDMRWWFSASDHQVNIVLLAKFDHSNQRIIIERWEEEIQIRPGATTTTRAASSAVQPVLRQSIIITRDAATDSYHVARSALALSFRLLFLRDPGPQEGDFIISIADLKAYARDVWEVV